MDDPPSAMRPLLRTALAHAVALAPPDPVAFLAEYFAVEATERSPALRAQRILRSCSGENSELDEPIIADAYQALLDQSPYVTGLAHKGLLRALSSHWEPHVSSEFLNVLARKDSEVVSFAYFRLSALAVLLYEKIDNEVQALARLLDPSDSGSLDRSLVSSVLEPQLSFRRAKIDPQLSQRIDVRA
eukprot:m.508279 g.508279  ORF g.508279 m.508279 type:complete len:187 (-) comp57389_c0_seq28:2714-3274(-)